MSHEVTPRQQPGTPEYTPGSHPAPERLAEAMEAVIAESMPHKLSQMNEGQKSFLRNWLFALSSYASELTEEKRRMTGGGLPVRQIPKASSYILAGELEQKLYGEVLNGAISGEEARRQFSPQDIVYTTHPNFSQSRELANLTPEIFKSFLKMSPETLSEMGRGPEEARQAMKRQFMETGLGQKIEQALEHMRPRRHRSRADELDEATIDLIPRVYEGLTEEVNIMLKRAEMVGAFKGKRPSKLSFEQARDMAQMTSDHSTWFTDGDGKRTSHAWDNDYAIPAIKASAMRHYIQDLKGIKRAMAHLPVASDLDELIGDMQKKVEVVEHLRDTAKDRMLALTKLQTYAVAHGETPPRDEVEDERLHLRSEAAKYGKAWYEARTPEALSILKKEDFSARVLQLAEKLKQYEGDNFPKVASSFNHTSPVSQIDSLIIKASKGDFPVKIERRENANQHKEAMRFFLKNLSNAGAYGLLEGLAIPGSNPPQTLSKADLNDALRATTPGDEQRLRRVLEVVDDIATRFAKGEKLNDKEEQIASRFNEVLRATYTTISRSIAPGFKESPDAIPLELTAQESTFIDDVSPFYNSGVHYPGAFKRVVIAEAGSPSNLMLSNGSGHEIRSEAMLRDGNDVLTINIFKNLLGSRVDVVPLYEDPDAILNTPVMLENKLKHKGYHNALGFDADAAGAHAMRAMNGKDVSAYDFLRTQGFTDQSMAERKLDIDALKEAKVYLGPPKMLANSDSAKRGTLAASTLNQISVVESYEVAARNLLDAKDGQKYMFVNQVYLGQGGSVARTTGTDALVPIITEQGQHSTMTTGPYSAMKSVLRAATRLVARNSENEAAPQAGYSREMRPKMALETMAFGNPFGFRLDMEHMAELKEACQKAIRRRIINTRDDIKVPGTGIANGNGNGNGANENTRYEELLRKYGEDFIENYSARPASKGGKVDFVGIRAIGLAGKEFGMFSNIVGISEMFEFDGAGKLANLDLMAKLYQGDPSVKHNFDAAAYTACLSAKTLPHVWSKGGISVSQSEQGETVLTKEHTQVKLSELVQAYEHGATSHMNFDAADLALANIHQQTERFVSGLGQIRASVALGPSKETGSYAAAQNGKVRDPIELVPQHLRGTVEHAQELAGQMAAYFRKMEATPGVVENMKKNAKKADQMSGDAQSLRMAKDAYYQLMETSLEPQALGRVQLTAGRAA